MRKASHTECIRSWFYTGRQLAFEHNLFSKNSWCPNAWVRARDLAGNEGCRRGGIRGIVNDQARALIQMDVINVNSQTDRALRVDPDRPDSLAIRENGPGTGRRSLRIDLNGSGKIARNSN